MFNVYREEIDWGGRKLILETGRMARQADGAVLATLGVLSGHTLKHLLAVMAALVLARQYARDFDPR